PPPRRPLARRHPACGRLPRGARRLHRRSHPPRLVPQIPLGRARVVRARGGGGLSRTLGRRPPRRAPPVPIGFVRLAARVWSASHLSDLAPASRQRRAPVAPVLRRPA